VQPLGLDFARSFVIGASWLTPFGFAIKAAGELFKLLSVDDLHVDPRGTDEAFALKDVNCVCHSRSANSEHCCEIVVRDPSVHVANPILAHQQPAGEPMLDMATRIR